jgi:arginyl-tRNA--protein-N-Asp/Glu arginylyltransferase
MSQADDPSPDAPAQSAPAFSHYPAIPPPLAVSLTTSPVHPCSYFPERTAQMRALWASKMRATLYHDFMDSGFRRSGKVLYQPVCPGCRACQPIRIPVNRFAPDKSQRRCWRKNQNLIVTVAPPGASDESYALYLRYVRQWHGRDSAEESRESFQRFLYDSPVESLEFSYRDESGALLAIGICDISNAALSSVYFYFDPSQSDRSLGTFGALHELEYAKANAIPYYYLGYWIDGCGTMQYKNRFRPYELLGSNGNWIPMQ